MTMRRRQVLRAIAIVAISVAMGISTSFAVDAFAPAEASAYEFPVWDWNIFGTCDGGNCGTNPPAQVLGFSVTASSNRPWIITLNEVCDLQYLYIAQALVPLGYDGVFAKSNGTQDGVPSPIAGHPFQAVNCGTGPGKTGRFGNATFFLGVKAGAQGVLYYSQQIPGGDVRNLVCVPVNTFFGQRQECNTHLDPNAIPTQPGTTQIAQDNTAAWIASTHASQGNKVTVGGDRNMTPWRSWPGSGFVEIDTASPKLRTYSNTALMYKLDWIWAGPGHWSLPGAARYCPPVQAPPISDHCMLYDGRFGA